MDSAAIGSRKLYFPIWQLHKSKPNWLHLKHIPCYMTHDRFSRTAYRAIVPAVASPPPSSTAVMALAGTKLDTDVVEEDAAQNKRSDLFACPICYLPMIWIGNPGLSVDSIPGSSLLCRTCKKSYVGSKTHLELTASSGAKDYGEPMPFTTELFRFPLVSYLYERGWRQNFTVLTGFPGPEKEVVDLHHYSLKGFHFEMAMSYFKPALGGTIIDACCGSGLFSRLIQKSGLFSSVIALDYSENMLRQCYEFIKQEQNFSTENLILVRADISRLPFASSSVNAVLAGASINLWPSPSQAVAEISRVLRPGGVFVATTYILDGPFAVIPIMKTLRQTIRQISGNYTFLSESELEDLCTACGLVGFSCVRNGPFVMISAAKPS